CRLLHRHKSRTRCWTIDRLARARAAWFDDHRSARGYGDRKIRLPARAKVLAHDDLDHGDRRIAPDRESLRSADRSSASRVSGLSRLAESTALPSLWKCRDLQSSDRDLSRVHRADAVVAVGRVQNKSGYGDARGLVQPELGEVDGDQYRRDYQS